MDSRKHIPAQDSDIPELDGLDALADARAKFRASTRHLRGLRNRLENSRPVSREELLSAIRWHLEVHDQLQDAILVQLRLPAEQEAAEASRG